MIGSLKVTCASSSIASTEESRSDVRDLFVAHPTPAFSHPSQEGTLVSDHHKAKIPSWEGWPQAGVGPNPNCAEAEEIV